MNQFFKKSVKEMKKGKRKHTIAKKIYAFCNVQLHNLFKKQLSTFFTLIDSFEI